MAGLNDECAIPAILGAAGTGGIATRALARFGNKALDPVVAQLRSPDPDSQLAEKSTLRTNFLQNQTPARKRAAESCQLPKLSSNRKPLLLLWTRER